MNGRAGHPATRCVPAAAGHSFLSVLPLPWIIFFMAQLSAQGLAYAD